MNDRLERWELIVYPVAGALIVLLNNWPPTFYWSRLLKLEVLLWALVGVLEFVHWRCHLPSLARAVLIGLPMSLMATLLLPGNPRAFYWTVLGLFLFLGLLGWLFQRFDKWSR